MADLKPFFRIVPTHYGQDGTVSTHIDPNGTDGEYIRAVRIEVAFGFRFAPENPERWRKVATFGRYKRGGQWFLGCEAWHPDVPTAYTLFRDGVDRKSLSDVCDAFKLAYRETEAQRAETGDCYLYAKAKARLIALAETREVEA